MSLDEWFGDDLDEARDVLAFEREAAQVDRDRRSRYRLDDDSNAAIADRDELDDYELNP